MSALLVTAPELPSKEAMQALIQRELETCGPKIREAVAPLLIDLLPKILKWEYGKSEPFPAWVFADMGQRDVYAAYCLGGHGALGSPWGLVFKQDEYFGMDSGWYRSLRELLLDWGLEDQ
jgi:hypothetical protein